MPCHAAITEKLVTVTPEQEVEATIKALKKAQASAAVVIDENGQSVGLFTLHGLMKNLLPVSVALSGGFQADIRVNAAPGIAKRLKKVYPLKVQDLMDRKYNAIHPDTPLWEGVSLLVQHGEPLVVVEGHSGKPMGLITFQSALDELSRLKDSES